MSLKHLPVILFTAMVIVTGCKENNPKPQPVTITPQCGGPEIVAESTLPDYWTDQNGSIQFNDALTADGYGNTYITNTSTATADNGGPHVGIR